LRGDGVRINDLSGVRFDLKCLCFGELYCVVVKTTCLIGGGLYYCCGREF